MISCPVCDHKFDPVRAGKPRSLDQHRRYYGMIRAFFFHWPETHARQFTSENDMRIRAQMRAGYHDVAAEIPLVGLPRERALLLVESCLKAAGNYAVPILKGDTMVILKPRSISFGALKHLDACKLFDAVQTVLEQESGLKVEDVLREQHMA